MEKSILKTDDGEYFHICSIMEIDLFNSGFARDISIETQKGKWYIVINEDRIKEVHVSELSDDERLMGVFINGWGKKRERFMIDHFRIKFCPFCGLRLKRI